MHKGKFLNQVSRRACSFLALSLNLFLLACSEPSPEIAGMPEVIDYNWDVRPILSDNCFQCHGNDEQGLEAGLRLNDRTMALLELPESPGKFAIVAGEPENSELISRISSDDIDLRMPPEETHKTLSSLEIEILRRWIDEGAQYKEHWAFISPAQSSIPETAFAAQVINAIDPFIFSRLEDENLAPSAAAEKEVLINRVALTLTGLPPSLDEIDAFVADTNPYAYERLVDSLLASPRYAEHMSAYWMDLARWSETDGYLDDHHDRVLWPWRDWVINAFDNNMPFDQFGTWQLAGDLLPNASKEQILATAFLRLGKRSTENGAIEEEYLAETMIERTDNALGTAFMGLTLGCARCHDHRYDPISQKEYYSLGAFFSSNDEPGVYSPGFSGIQAGPTLPWTDADTEAHIEELAAIIERSEAQYRSTRAQVGDGLNTDMPGGTEQIAALIQSSLNSSLAAYYPFDSATAATVEQLPPKRPKRPAPEELSGFDFSPALSTQDRDSLTPTQIRQLQRNELTGRVPTGWVAEQLALSPSGLAGVAPAVIQAPLFDTGVNGQALFFDENNKGFLGMDVGWYDRTDPFSIDFWFYANEAYENVPIINHRNEQNSGTTGYSLAIKEGKLWLQLAHSPPANMLALSSLDEFPLQQWTHLTLTYDGSSQAAGAKLFLNGQLIETNVEHDTLNRSILPWSNGDVFETFVGVAIGTRFREKAPVGSGMDELRFFDKKLSPLEVAFLHDQTQALSSVEFEQGFSELLLDSNEQVVAAQSALTSARQAHNELVTLVPQVLVMRDLPEPVPTFVLNRGLYSSPGEQVYPEGLPSVLAWDESLPQNRLGLTQWLFHEDNPLTARVFVNRLWQMHFARGIVETSEDFGSQGSIPSHPELLDYLSLEFMQSGWDIKAMHKLIVTSATYRQSSIASDELLAVDARNQLLARGPSWRMTAEMVRDQALLVSGLLTADVGGESAMPYQPQGIWNSGNAFYAYPEPDSIDVDEHHRRTLYTFIKRNAMNPALSIFDFTNRTESKSRRSSSNTPLQALDLMNDPQYMEAYRALATVVLREDIGTSERLQQLYRLATRIRPSQQQLALLNDYFVSQQEIMREDETKVENLLSIGVSEVDSELDPAELAAMTNVAALVMNSPDAYTVQ